MSVALSIASIARGTSAAGIGAEGEQRAHGEQQHQQPEAHREAQQPTSHGSERLSQAQVDLPSGVAGRPLEREA